MSVSNRRAHVEHRPLDLAMLGDATAALNVSHRATMSVQIDGAHTTGAVKIEARLTGGPWVDLLDNAGAAIIITGPAMVRKIDVVGVDDARVTVSTVEAGKEAAVLMSAWGDER